MPDTSLQHRSDNRTVDRSPEVPEVLPITLRRPNTLSRLDTLPGPNTQPRSNVPNASLAGYYDCLPTESEVRRHIRDRFLPKTHISRVGPWLSHVPSFCSQNVQHSDVEVDESGSDSEFDDQYEGSMVVEGSTSVV